MGHLSKTYPIQSDKINSPSSTKSKSNYIPWLKAPTLGGSNSKSLILDESIAPQSPKSATAEVIPFLLDPKKSLSNQAQIQ